jgi:hypothetical protein
VSDRQFNVLFWVVVVSDVLLLVGVPQLVVRLAGGQFNQFDYVPVGMLNAYVLSLKPSREKRDKDDKKQRR